MFAEIDRKLTPEEYLTWESVQDTKYEYENGKIVAMTGGTLAHARIIANLSRIFGNALTGSKCDTFAADAKVMTPRGRFYYPDLVISCDERDKNANDHLRYPQIIIEVLSPSTEGRDRGIKQQHYMLIHTLRAYILVTPEIAKIEVFERDAEDSCWRYYLIDSIGDSFPIGFDQLVLNISEIYEGVNFRSID